MNHITAIPVLNEVPGASGPNSAAPEDVSIYAQLGYSKAMQEVLAERRRRVDAALEVATKATGLFRAT